MRDVRETPVRELDWGRWGGNRGVGMEEREEKATRESGERSNGEIGARA